MKLNASLSEAMLSDQAKVIAQVNGMLPEFIESPVQVRSEAYANTVQHSPDDRYSMEVRHAAYRRGRKRA